MWPTSSAEAHARPVAAPAVGAFPAGEGATGPSAAPSPAIYTSGLQKRYGKTVAVRSLSVAVGRGEVFGFLGPNGAGKTTVVKMLLGLARPTAGEAMVLGAPVGDRESRRRIGYLPELFRFQPWLTAREVLQLHCRLIQMRRSGWEAAIDDALETVSLADRGTDKVAGFSKGMQQRLGLAVAMLGDPALVFLDEPTSALDPVGRHQVRQIVRRLRDGGVTVFLNTHLLAEAEQVCDRVAVLHRGEVVADGPLPELLGQHGRVRVKLATAPAGWPALAEAFGRCRQDGDWTVVEGIAPGKVPDLVDGIVSGGGRLEALVPEHQTLEERFLELLGER
jgi:ABC-2 type transport system ATP-binding protein